MAVKRRAAVLAIDPGTKRTGFAVADALRVAIEPLATFHGPEGGEAWLAHVARLVGERELELVLLGLPVGPRGEPSERSCAVLALRERLAARFPGLAIVTYDERWTTKEAEARLVDSGRTGRARKAARDAWSAAVLLEDWIRSGEPR